MKLGYMQNDEGYFYTIRDEFEDRYETISDLKRIIKSVFIAESKNTLDPNVDYAEYELSVYGDINIVKQIEKTNNIDDCVTIQAYQGNNHIYNLEIYGYKEKRKINM